MNKNVILATFSILICCGQITSCAAFKKIDEPIVDLPISLDSLKENTITPIPVKGSQVYRYGVVIYTGNLDTLIKEISSSHNVSMPEQKWKISGQSFYWKLITDPYWYYGGHCLLLDVKKLKDSKWQIEMRMNYAWRKPNSSRKIAVYFRFDFYQEVVDRAVQKSIIH